MIAAIVLSDAAFSAAAWEVECARGIASRPFCILHTGGTSSVGSNSLHCAGIELDGVLSETGKQ